MSREKCPQCGNERNSANLFCVDTRWPNNGGGTYCGQCLSDFLEVALKDVVFMQCREDDEIEPHYKGKCLLCKALGRFGDEDMIPYAELVELVKEDATGGNIYAASALEVLEFHAPKSSGECCRPAGTLECGTCGADSRNLEGHGALWPCDSYKAIEKPIRNARALVGSK